MSRQREIERKFTEERDKLFKEFSCAKSEIQRNFNKQRHELELAFHQEIQKLYKVHEGQINTIKLQMRDSQLGDLHERLRGKLSRHLSWPIAESIPKQSNDMTLDGSLQQNQLKQSEKIKEKDENKTSDEWQILVQHLKFALNNQKALFENALLEEKLKMQKQLELERVGVEEKLFKRLNFSLQDALKDRNVILKESDNVNQISRNMLSDWVLIKEYSKQKDRKKNEMIESDSDEENSGDSGVDERGRTKGKRGNYWRVKYVECQKKYAKKLTDMEEGLKRKEESMKDEIKIVKLELKEKHLQELNDVQNIAAKELQKSLKEERNANKSTIKEMNEKVIKLSNENDELRTKLNELQNLLDSDVNELQNEMREKLEILKEMLSREN